MDNETSDSAKLPLTITVKDGDAYQLLKVKALQDARVELERFLKRRILWATVIFTVLGLVGLPLLVHYSLQNLIEDEVMNAKAARFAAEESASEAIKSARSASKLAEAAQARLQSATGQLGRLEKSYSSLDADMGVLKEQLMQEQRAARESARELERLVQLVVAETRDGIALLSEYEEERSQLELRNESERQAFVDNSRYEVRVYAAEAASKVVNAAVTTLRQRGFRASVPFGTSGFVDSDYWDSGYADSQQVFHPAVYDQDVYSSTSSFKLDLSDVGTFESLVAPIGNTVFGSRTVAGKAEQISQLLEAVQGIDSVEIVLASKEGTKSNHLLVVYLAGEVLP